MLWFRTPRCYVFFNCSSDVGCKFEKFRVDTHLSKLRETPAVLVLSDLLPFERVRVLWMLPRQLTSTSSIVNISNGGNYTYIVPKE